MASLPAIGCGGGSSGGAGGASGNNQTPTFCPEATRVGGFSVQLIEAVSNKAAYTSFGGGVKDGVDPTLRRQELAVDGACKVTSAAPLSCSPACTGTQVCAGDNKCVTDPSYQDVGTVTVSGLSMPISTMPPSLPSPPVYYSDLSAFSYPPFAPGGEVKLMTSGGKVPAFSLSQKGFAPLEFPGTGLSVGRNKALTVTWTAAAAGSTSRIFVRMDISHHGGGTARVECDVADTGSTTIPSGLINKLLDQGTAGFPTLSLTRRLAASTTITPGCVDLVIASPVERELMVEGVVSCNCTMGDSMNPCQADSVPCPGGKVCLPQLICGS